MLSSASAFEANRGPIGVELFGDDHRGAVRTPTISDLATVTVTAPSRSIEAMRSREHPRRAPAKLQSSVRGKNVPEQGAPVAGDLHEIAAAEADALIVTPFRGGAMDRPPDHVRSHQHSRTSRRRCLVPWEPSSASGAPRQRSDLSQWQ
jgi:hypothetical protein